MVKIFIVDPYVFAEKHCFVNLIEVENYVL